MKPLGMHNYYVYITTNYNKTVLYIGVTNDLERRLAEHKLESKSMKTFAGRYNCFNLLYYEHFHFIHQAIDREKELKGWRRSKKVELINSLNPDWSFLSIDLD